jgi:acyl carrier protein
MNDPISILAGTPDLEVAAERGAIAVAGPAGGDDTPAAPAPVPAPAAPAALAPIPAPTAQRRAQVIAFLRREAARFLEVDLARLPAERSLLALGLDSLSAAELAGAIEAGLGVQMPIASLLQGPSLAELGEQVLRLLAEAAAPGTGAAPAASAGAQPDAAPAARFPLSWGQRAVWLLDRLASGNPAYVIAGAGRIVGELAVPELRRALAALVARHSSLRSTFELDGEEAVQVVHQDGALAFAEEDAAGWSTARLEQRLIEEAHRSFDLALGPLLRIAILHRGAEHFVVLAVHHIVADFGSLGVLLDEMGRLYGGESLPPPAAASYADFVRLEAERLAGSRGDRLRAYWSAALPPGRPPLELPTDRPRPPLQTFRGGAQALRLDSALTASLHAASRAAGATPFMTLLAIFLALLHRHSGQEEILVGTPTAGRGASELAGLVGYCVNPVVVRGDLAGDPSFLELLGRVREAAIGAFSHQDYPFPLLAERLGAERDASRSPVFQAMFTLYREVRQGERGLGGFALGEAGSHLRLGSLQIESVRLPRRAAQLDLTLLAAEIDGGLAASLQFNSDLFDAATVARMLGQLRTMISAVGAVGAVAGASAPAAAGGALAQLPAVSALPLLAAAERHQLMLEWNDTAVAPSGWQPGPARLRHRRQFRRSPLPRRCCTSCSSGRRRASLGPWRWPARA